MRSRNAAINIITVWLGQVLIIVVNMIARKVFLQSLGSEYLGLNSLFTNIVGLLAVADLGFGSAISFSLYKPLAENNKEAIKAIMKLFKKIYCLIGIIIFISGFALTPWIYKLATGAEEINNIRLIFMLFVLNTSISYFFSYYSALIIADQKKYIFNIFHYIVQFMMFGAQIIILNKTKNYYLYLSCQILATIIENWSMSIVAKRSYPYLCEQKVESVSEEEIHNIKKNVKALVLYKVGITLVTSTDNILISKLTNLSIVGIYGNYSTIVTAVCNVFWQGITAFTASIGNQLVSGTKEGCREVFSAVQLIGSWLYGWGCICLFVLLTPFIKLWYGEYTLDLAVVVVICLNSYLSGQRTVLQSYINAAGLYHNVRYKAIEEGCVNIIVSIVLGMRFGLIGVLGGTFVSGVLCGWIPETKVILNVLMEMKISIYIKMQIRNVCCIIIAGYLTKVVSDCISSSGIKGFAVKMLLCVIIPNVVIMLLNHRSNAFRTCIHKAKHVLKR